MYFEADHIWRGHLMNNNGKTATPFPCSGWLRQCYTKLREEES